MLLNHVRRNVFFDFKDRIAVAAFSLLDLSLVTCHYLPDISTLFQSTFVPPLYIIYFAIKSRTNTVPHHNPR